MSKPRSSSSFVLVNSIQAQVKAPPNDSTTSFWAAPHTHAATLTWRADHSDRQIDQPTDHHLRGGEMRANIGAIPALTTSIIVVFWKHLCSQDTNGNHYLAHKLRPQNWICWLLLFAAPSELTSDGVQPTGQWCQTRQKKRDVIVLGASEDQGAEKKTTGENFVCQENWKI